MPPSVLVNLNAASPSRNPGRRRPPGEPAAPEPAPEEVAAQNAVRQADVIRAAAERLKVFVNTVWRGGVGTGGGECLTQFLEPEEVLLGTSKPSKPCELPVFLPVTYLRRVSVKAAASGPYNSALMCILVFISLPSFCHTPLLRPVVLPGRVRTFQSQHHFLLF